MLNSGMSINFTVVNGVATIEIARPEKKNALTAAMYQSMAEAIVAARADTTVRALLIIGQPGIFTAGNDLADFMANPPSSIDSPVFRFMRALMGCEKPVVAAVTGAAIGIGTTLLLHCDLVYVAEDARFAMPFTSLGLVPEFASSLLLPQLMGRVQAAVRTLRLCVARDLCGQARMTRFLRRLASGTRRRTAPHCRRTPNARSRVALHRRAPAPSRQCRRLGVIVRDRSLGLAAVRARRCSR